MDTELWHIIYRGVDGRKIFIDNQDRARFVHDLYEFNDKAPAQSYVRRLPNVGHVMSDIRERIIDLHGWKLMPNHIHLILSARVENGLSLFLQKMRGYGRYFNERHERHGRLLDTIKKVLIKSEPHFLYLLHYVHLNGLDDFPDAKGWRERDKGSIKNVMAALEHLKKDRWSSYRDYCGVHNFPSILTKTLYEDVSGEYAGELATYLSDRSDDGLDSRLLE
ncbi:MAG: transposase [Patescibacteria group bacterium]|nr:transposase [Patescibacteria group bacterium]